MTIRRNANGQQHLGDLRKELAKRDDVTVYQQGSSWILSQYVGDCWRTTTLPYWYDERKAIQKALWGDYEARHARQSA